MESPLPQGNWCRHITSTKTVESKFKDIYIGKLIQQKVDERGISYAEFARQIHCARTSLYHGATVVFQLPIIVAPELRTSS
ncbi:hypothetical protein ADH74_19255 [Bacteroides caecimuris]|uniref:Uncharacterized protein n=1 Tax=Bacteroides caecimuris TaxID=1796613 RepID=A0A1C7GVL3_9BACE|nr:hypothetical protein A4V03_01375 [Bacteroides caecimuris]OXE61148.1 hypothetical protein ADH74_19255 [Bacteroides caecimuris]